MDIRTATDAYESWLRMRVRIVEDGLKLKHRLMTESPSALLRATFYRWVSLWRGVCADLAAAPRVLAVGDLHIENFGTWRDAEGRLVWGLNDADEAAPMPYTIDLVRLATSALLAIEDRTLAIGPKPACRAVLEGYTEALEQGGRPFVLEEDHSALRDMAFAAERDPKKFWKKLTSFPRVRAAVSVSNLLRAQLPDPKLKFTIVHRVSGLGSLGRPRYVALALHDVGRIAREAKALVPSAYNWALGRTDAKLYPAKILAQAVRCRDPFASFASGWAMRRLAPHCSRITLSELPKKRDERKLLRAMGWETANVHLGSRSAMSAVIRDLRKRDEDWLYKAGVRMTEATLIDWKAWLKSS